MRRYFASAFKTLTLGNVVGQPAGGTVIGILDEVEFEEGVVELRPGDRVLLYTDGISEAARESGEMFGEDRIHAAIERLPASLTARAVTSGTEATRSGSKVAS